MVIAGLPLQSRALTVRFAISGLNTRQLTLCRKPIHCKAFGGTLDDVECMKLTGLARNTYYKYKRQIRAELADEEKT